MTEMIDDLERQTDFLSSPYAMRATPAFIALVEKGAAAIPELAEALRASRAVIPVMMALGKITGHDPGGKSVTEARDGWLKWNGLDANAGTG